MFHGEVLSYNRVLSFRNGVMTRIQGGNGLTAGFVGHFFRDAWCPNGVFFHKKNEKRENTGKTQNEMFFFAFFSA